MFFITSAGSLNRFRSWTWLRRINQSIFFILLFLCSIHIFVVPSFAASSPTLTFTNLEPVDGLFGSNYSTGSTWSGRSCTFSISGTSIAVNASSTSTADTKGFALCMGADFDVDFNVLEHSSYDYVRYWKITAVCKGMVSNLGSGTLTGPRTGSTNTYSSFPNGISLYYRGTDSSSRVAFSSSLEPLGSGFYGFQGFMRLDDVVSQFNTIRCSFYYDLSTRSSKSFNLQGEFEFLSLELIPVNEIEYEQWSSTQNIENALTQSPSSVSDQNQQTANAAQDFNNEVNDFAELNGSLDRPQANTDFQTNIDLITGGLYDYSVVQSFFTPLYESIPIAFFLLVTASFCVIGYVLYGKRG